MHYFWWIRENDMDNTAYYKPPNDPIYWVVALMIMAVVVYLCTR